MQLQARYESEKAERDKVVAAKEKTDQQLLSADLC